MKKQILAMAVGMLSVIALSACSRKELEFKEDEMLKLAKTQVQQLISGDFDAVANTFDEQVKKQLSTEALQASYEQVTDTIGAYIGEYSISHEITNDYFVAYVTEEFEHSGLKITLTYNLKKEISGLHFGYENLSDELVSNELWAEEVFNIGEEYSLDGILTLPKGAEKPPVVLFIHGSGQSDKNETIALNTPFMDLAHGLAEKGIATLRYDKRFFTYPDEAAKFGNDLTLKEEVLDDAAIAITQLTNDPRVGDIYVLGHSLGGGLTPYIAYENKNISGIISMAGTLRPLYELSYDQNKAIEQQVLSQEPLNEAEMAVFQSQMEQVEKDILTLRGDISNLPNEEVLLGLPVGYQKSIKEYAGENFIDNIDLPILILQGDADFQVYPTTDFELWNTTLSGRNHVTFKLYEGLNHLMMKTNGKTDITEYQTKGVVEQVVIDDIYNFITNR